MKPLAFARNPSRGLCLVVTSWLIALLSAMPVTCFTLIKEVDGLPQCWIDLDTFGWQMYVLYLLVSLLVVPTIIIAICYAHIVWTIWSKARQVELEERARRRDLLLASERQKLGLEPESERRKNPCNHNNNNNNSHHLFQHQSGRLDGREMGPKAGEIEEEEEEEKGKEEGRGASERACELVQPVSCLLEAQEQCEGQKGKLTTRTSCPSFGQPKRKQKQRRSGRRRHRRARQSMEGAREATASGPTGERPQGRRVSLQADGARSSELGRNSGGARLSSASSADGADDQEERQKLYRHTSQLHNAHLGAAERTSSGSEHQMAGAKLATIRAAVEGELARQVAGNQAAGARDQQVEPPTTSVAGEPRAHSPSGGGGVHSSRQHGTGVIPKARIKTIKMTLVIVVAYILCWSPFLILNLLSVFGLLQSESNVIQAAMTLSQSLAHLNSAVNPIIYWLFSSRVQVKRKLGQQNHKRPLLSFLWPLLGQPVRQRSATSATSASASRVLMADHQPIAASAQQVTTAAPASRSNWSHLLGLLVVPCCCCWRRERRQQPADSKLQPESGHNRTEGGAGESCSQGLNLEEGARAGSGVRQVFCLGPDAAGAKRQLDRRRSTATESGISLERSVG